MIGDKNGKVTLYDKKCNFLNQILFFSQPVKCLKWDTDTYHSFYVSFCDGTIKQWKIITPEIKREIKRQGECCIPFSDITILCDAFRKLEI